MNFSTISADHNFVLVECKENTTYFRLGRVSEIFGLFRPNDSYYNSSETNNLIPCDVIMTSNDIEKLRARMVQHIAYNMLHPHSRVNMLTTFGPHETLINKNFFSRIRWCDYRSATQNLLCAVFSRETLATHTVAGRQSPKLKLDANKIDDIISIVTNKCNVTREHVLQVITYRCWFEDRKHKQRKSPKGKK
ncbi:PREDICTED: protein insensitive-like [Nicrophorus vespilloides]|uniref:Protein insensitive-like n=1 Tax=Nicrophorus vespilloides TaxID=110193 RepID=A0ABM1MQ18_NICVS|nr:PREDICTED: protein insensitive-like [Nicrophorus vespilloides]